MKSTISKLLEMKSAPQADVQVRSFSFQGKWEVIFSFSDDGTTVRIQKELADLEAALDFVYDRWTELYSGKKSLVNMGPSLLVAPSSYEEVERPERADDPPRAPARSAFANPVRARDDEIPF